MEIDWESPEAIAFRSAYHKAMYDHTLPYGRSKIDLMDCITIEDKARKNYLEEV